MAAETGAAMVGGAKLLGGAAGATGVGAALAAVVVMLMTLPRTGREWAVGLISTVLASLAGGAAAIIKLGLLTQLQAVRTDTELFFALMGLAGVVFACGLPGWAVVRWVFNWMERRRAADIAEVVAEVRGQITGGGNA